MERACTASVVPFSRRTCSGFPGEGCAVLVATGAWLRSIAYNPAATMIANAASAIQRNRLGGEGGSGLGSGSGPGCSDRESGSGVTSAGAVDMGDGYSRCKNYFLIANVV